MKRNTQLPFLLGLGLVLLLALPAVAGPLFPCVKAVGSKKGNFLVLTDVQPEPGQGNTQRVLSRVDHGVFIKRVVLKGIWPPDKLGENTAAWDEETPQWFAGGTFEFSSYGRQLTHKTHGGNTVHINLRTDPFLGSS
jgi:hypothetical protein